MGNDLELEGWMLEGDVCSPPPGGILSVSWRTKQSHSMSHSQNRHRDAPVVIYGDTNRAPSQH